MLYRPFIIQVNVLQIASRCLSYTNAGSYETQISSHPRIEGPLKIHFHPQAEELRLFTVAYLLPTVDVVVFAPRLSTMIHTPVLSRRVEWQLSLPAIYWLNTISRQRDYDDKAGRLMQQKGRPNMCCTHTPAPKKRFAETIGCFPRMKLGISIVLSAYYMLIQRYQRISLGC